MTWGELKELLKSAKDGDVIEVAMPTSVTGNKDSYAWHGITGINTDFSWARDEKTPCVLIVLELTEKTQGGDVLFGF